MLKFNYLDNYKIWETIKSLRDLPKKKISILFTDMVGSSKYWEKSENNMWKAIQLHEKQIKRLSKKYSGNIVKSIGDSWMIVFEGKDSLLDSLKFASDLQKDLKESPIKIMNKNLKIRIGISYGNTWERKTYIQGNQNKDYLGPNVNAASRMESRLSDEGGFAWTIEEGEKMSKKVENWLIENEINVHEIDFKMDCVKNRKRSARHFSDAQILSCRSPKKLGGVNIVKAWKTN